MRCRLEDRTLPGACLVLVATVILTKVILALSQHRSLDVLDLLIQLALATGLFHLIVSGRSSLWTIVEVPGGIKMERDGTVLYEGPVSEIQIVDEDCGIMTLRSSGGSSFQFPRRRVFHEIVSQIVVPQHPIGEQAAGYNRRQDPSLNPGSPSPVHPLEGSLLK